jgi:hypothetical protein
VQVSEGEEGELAGRFFLFGAQFPSIFSQGFGLFLDGFDNLVRQEAPELDSLLQLLIATSEIFQNGFPHLTRQGGLFASQKIAQKSLEFLLSFRNIQGSPEAVA